MATAIKCVVARVGRTVPVPPLFASDRAARQISQHFRDGSSSNIRLRVDLDKVKEPFEPGSSDDEIRPFDLHLATETLLGRSGPGSGRVDRIAVLLARRYTYRKALGVMFDRGFLDTRDGDTVPCSEPDLAGSPREACALFLDTIAAYGREPVEQDEGLLFTAVHEIAHVFNLQHRSDKNFLVDPIPKRLHGHWGFHDDAADLGTDPLDDHVHPGASIFGKRGTTTPPCPDAVRSSARAGPFGLSLSVAPSRHEFFYFEPVELCVRLGFLPGVGGRESVPDEIDSGYRRFRIWIEEPTGERRLYRSPRRYCSAGRRRTIDSARSPFERDVSVFGETGGYTFRTAGVHRLWAELDLGGAKGTLRSAPQEVRLMARPELKGPTAELGRLLTSRAGKAVAYHRYIPSEGPGLRACEGAADEGPPSAARSELRYALGIGYAHLAKLGGEGAIEAARKARRWLEPAADDDHLDPHRRDRARERTGRLRRAPGRGRRVAAP